MSANLALLLAPVSLPHSTAGVPYTTRLLACSFNKISALFVYVVCMWPHLSLRHPCVCPRLQSRASISCSCWCLASPALSFEQALLHAPKELPAVPDSEIHFDQLLALFPFLFASQRTRLPLFASVTAICDHLLSFQMPQVHTLGPLQKVRRRVDTEARFAEHSKIVDELRGCRIIMAVRTGPGGGDVPRCALLQPHPRAALPWPAGAAPPPAPTQCTAAWRAPARQPVRWRKTGCR